MLRRENLYRAVTPSFEVRDGSDGGMPTLTGHFAVFDTPTIVNSRYEGHFLERIERGAFAKTMSEARNSVKVMFNHGRDPQIGEKPLASIDVMREDDKGAYYEAPLLDTSYVRDLLPALKAGLLGASFRFSVVRDHVDPEPKPSPSNPDGIPERTVKEVRLYEFGPVVNPQYPEATAGVRSITDLILDVDAMTAATPILLDEERLQRARIFVSRSLPEEPAEETPTTEATEAARGEETETTAPATDNAEEPSASHLVKPARRGEPLYGLTKEKPTWLL